MRYTNNQKADLSSAYASALKLAVSHYENFPVISFFIPKHLKNHVAIIYQFARQADDIADEGDMSGEERIKKLDEYRSNLENSIAGEFESKFWFALNNTIQEFNLTKSNFFNLLTAFKQDVTKNRFKNFDEILLYCNHSANPVGRLILELFGIREDKLFSYSDLICTALQLTNFYQDISIDIKKNRIYIPLDEMDDFGVTEKQLVLKQNNDNFKSLIKYQINRTKEMFGEGEKLIPRLPGSLKYEIKWTLLGGGEILNKIELNDYDVFDKRPKLNILDKLKLIIKGLVLK